MAAWMGRAGAELLAAADVVVPVPLHHRRLWWRRFNQSAELARRLVGDEAARGRALVYEPLALARVKATRSQVGLGRRQREDNVRGAFRVRPERRSAVLGKRVLLVDDVFTTGATVGAASRALKRAGARDVDVLTFAGVAAEE
jgi:ComF family protein